MVKDGLWIIATIVLVPVIGVLGGFMVGACLVLVIVGAITLPVWLPLYLLARWLRWRSPRYRAGVFSRFWLREKVSDWKQDGPSVAGAIRSSARTRPSGRRDRPAAF